ncbi:MAG: HEAT repeat domain-containing protein [Planctomycetes bacterium]|nr:HEAT repeat domain-containing protein [Planctomycetota bacterium]
MLHLIFIGILLCRPPEGATIAELAEKLGSDDARVRAEARDELLRRGESALPGIREALGGDLDPVATSLLAEIAERIEIRAKEGKLIESLSPAFRKAAPGVAERLVEAGFADLGSALRWLRLNTGRLDKCTQADRIVVSRLALGALARHRGEPRWGTVIGEVVRGFQADPDLFYDELRPLVDHPDDELCRWVLDEIRKVRRPERAADMLALLGGTPGERAAASRALGNMPAGAHSAAIAEALKRVGPKAEAGLLRALRRTGEAGYAEAVLDCADSGDPEVRQEALAALFRLDPYRGLPKILAALGDPDEKVLSRIVLVAAETHDAGIQAKVESVWRDAKTPGLRQNALYTLAGYRGERAVRAVLEALTGEDDGQRIGAAAAAAMLKDERVTDALRKALDDVNPAVAANAAMSLAWHTTGVRLEKVRSLLESAVPYVRASALLALARLPDPAAEKRIVELLSDPDSYVRFRATETAGELRLASARAALLPRLRDPEPLVRLMAALALSRIGEKSAVPVLADMLDTDLRAQILPRWPELAAPSLEKILSVSVVRVNPARPGRVRDLVATLTAALKDSGVAVHDGLPDFLLEQPVEWHGGGLPPDVIPVSHLLWTLYDSCCKDFGWFADESGLHLLTDAETCRRWKEWAKSR